MMAQVWTINDFEEFNAQEFNEQAFNEYTSDNRLFKSY